MALFVSPNDTSNAQSALQGIKDHLRQAEQYLIGGVNLPLGRQILRECKRNLLRLEAAVSLVEFNAINVPLQQLLTITAEVNEIPVVSASSQRDESFFTPKVRTG